MEESKGILIYSHTVSSGPFNWLEALIKFLHDFDYMLS